MLMAKVDVANLPKDTDSLKEMIADLVDKHEQQINEHQLKYQLLEEKYLSLRNKFFGRSSEKLTEEDKQQMRLFNEAEDGCDEQELLQILESELIQVPEHRRRKRGRRPLPQELPRREIVHDLPEEQKRCQCCGKQRPCIGKETVLEELDVIPAKIEVISHTQVKYGPCGCDGFAEKEYPEVLAATLPPRMIPRSIASPGMLAYVLTGKFVDSLPFYRLEKILKRIGVHLPRATMCNWAIHTARKCGALIELMWEGIRAGPLIRMDETTLQVLREPGRAVESTSYMWVTIGYAKIKPIIVFHYHPSRSGQIPLEILKDYEGYLQSDGYRGYEDAGSLPGIKHVGCFAHARRKFKNAAKVMKKAGSAHVAIGYIRKLYLIEDELRSHDLEPEDFVRERKEQIQPLLDKFHTWLLGKSETVLPKSLLGIAVNYALGEWEKLERYTQAWFLTPDNNAAENAIRPFVVGRKNWLFNNTPQGAHASAALYSLIETAKANELEPYRYLRYLFTKLPYAQSKEELKSLLPTELNASDLGEI